VIHDRTEQASARLRSYAERKLSRLSRHFDRVLDAQVELTREAARTNSWTVQIVVHMDGRKHPLAQARETAADVQSALDLAIDKVDRQVVKLKEKIKIERKRPGGNGAGGADVRERDPGPERIRLRLRPESLADAEAALAGNARGFHIFLDEDSGEIAVCYRRPDGGLAVIEPVT